MSVAETLERFDRTETLYRTRSLFKKGLASVYGLGFVVAVNQFLPLLGTHGLLPFTTFIHAVPFAETPSLLYWFPSDRAVTWISWSGLVLAVTAVTGLADRYSTWLSVGVWSLMWVLYLSLMNVGQVFYGFGWESLLLEAGFYAIFLGPSKVEPPKIMIWILRWLLFRLMFGAGLIKLRGDACWRDLTCLDYHYETQPMPNRWSYFFHWAPEWTHRAGVLVNHFCELIVPFGYGGPRVVRITAGICTIVFQSLIMASGNLAWLNYLAMVLALTLFDDRFWSRGPVTVAVTRPALQYASVAVGVMVLYLSIGPVRNLLSADQAMNQDYNPLHLVGSYGAFGSVSHPRNEVIIEGTDDVLVGPNTVWKEYEFYGKPGDVNVRPSQVAPYHLRLGWLLWFAAMSSPNEHPWLVHFMGKLLQNDPGTLSIVQFNPFPLHPPHFVRAELYEYHFATPQEHRESGAWWTRRLVGLYFPVVSLDMPFFRRLLESQGWL